MTSPDAPSELRGVSTWLTLTANWAAYPGPVWVRSLATASLDPSASHG